MSEFKTPIKKIQPVDDKIVIPASPFLNRLGYGTGVSVLQLVRSPRAGLIRSPWALKMLNKRVKPNKVYSERLQLEAELLQRMSHPNIVGFRAFSKANTLFLGMEACEISLGDKIEKRVEEGCEPFTHMQILKVALDIGKALDYLHTKMQLLHGDIKSYNILVNGDFEICKLCDFGVTLPLDENGVFDKMKAGNAVYYGTEAWSAPEVIHGGEISSKTDIWPLGLTLWEMMALMPPHSQLDETADDSMNLDQSAESFDEEYFSQRYGTCPPVPANIGGRYSGALRLLRRCVEPAAAARAAAADVVADAAELMARELDATP
ncbi:lymphokine-activated killer T-cell-originated protein kinase homolog isoform X2 [Plodia interpunctella]|uniref:lymphokine-activated killer T-cell-originated protein kinase homolog isoform X2 n=1 Tax=Plodia interpunctella TaxID=58824 RepID=UPI002367E4AF|nr:lymphokine-activated killer T-cell-originated protein kinase homolog isoform X2 [Plodia interpunctella]